jgi:AbrB family looped-hinge helix DNA binding protein
LRAQHVLKNGAKNGNCYANTLAIMYEMNLKTHLHTGSSEGAVDLAVDSAGRIVLPAQTRRLLGLRPGSKLRMAVVAQRIELTPAPADSDTELAVSAGGRLVLAAASVANGGPAPDAAAAVRAERDAQAQPKR